MLCPASAAERSVLHIVGVRRRERDPPPPARGCATVGCLAPPAACTQQRMAPLRSSSVATLRRRRLGWRPWPWARGKAEAARTLLPAYPHRWAAPPPSLSSFAPQSRVARDAGVGRQNGIVQQGRFGGFSEGSVRNRMLTKPLNQKIVSRATNLSGLPFIRPYHVVSPNFSRHHKHRPCIAWIIEPTHVD